MHIMHDSPLIITVFHDIDDWILIFLLGVDEKISEASWIRIKYTYSRL